MATAPQFGETLTGTGLRPGDTLLVVFGENLPARLGSRDDILGYIIKVLGPSGTLVIPAFGFYPSQGPIEIPPFADALLGLPDHVLSNHPTHPVAAIGRLASVITENHGPTSAFGRNTPLFKLLQANGKVLQVGCEFSENPMVFVAEEIAGVPYVSRSRPISVALPSGKAVTRWIKQPGCHRGFGVLAEAVGLGGSLVESMLFGAPIRLVDARSIFRAATEALSVSADGLLCLEPDCELCAEARAIIDANAADESDKRVAEQAEENERMTRDLERKLDGGLAKFVDSSDADFSSN